MIGDNVHLPFTAYLLPWCNVDLCIRESARERSNKHLVLISKCGQHYVLDWMSKLFHQLDALPARLCKGLLIHFLRTTSAGLLPQTHSVGAIGACIHSPPPLRRMAVILTFIVTLLKASACCCSNIQILSFSTCAEPSSQPGSDVQRTRCGVLPHLKPQSSPPDYRSQGKWKTWNRPFRGTELSAL